MIIHSKNEHQIRAIRMIKKSLQGVTCKSSLDTNSSQGQQTTAHTHIHTQGHFRVTNTTKTKFMSQKRKKKTIYSWVYVIPNTRVLHFDRTL